MTSINTLKDLKGRRALITGASGGLGVVIAETLAELGSDLILVDRHSSDLEKVKKHISEKNDLKVSIFKCDLENEKERIKLSQQVNKDNYLNCLINCAAFTGDSSLKGWSVKFEDQTIETWRRALEVNLTAAFHLCQLFTPYLEKSKGAK